MQAYNQAGFLVDEWKSEFMYHVYTCIGPNNTAPATRLKVLPFTELWTGENQFKTEPSRGSCLITPWETDRGSQTSERNRITSSPIYCNCSKQFFQISNQMNKYTHSPLPRVYPHWPFAAAALPPGCLSWPPLSCSLKAAQDRSKSTQWLCWK